MKINPINFNLLRYNNKIKQKNFNNNTQTNKTFNYGFYYLSFLGGYSLNLKDTITNLDKFGYDIYPSDIRELAIEELEKGNRENKTLIDIHKSKYELLNECVTLDEIKELYPEFKDVLSDSQITYNKGCLIDKIKSGQIENFNPDEDLSIQLLKLYWAEGLSFTDLENKTGGIQIYNLAKKLNIPTMTRHYGHILKLSDKDYNERLSKIMSEKIAESKDRQAQKEEGEPVYIPRGPLSENHKKHISEGLVKHYSENPEKLHKMSEKQKAFWEGNIELKLMMQKAMTYAWNNTQEGKSVKKHLIKFFKKQNVQLGELENNILADKTPEQKKTLKIFWEKNSWAKGQFSTAVKKGWQKAKEEKEQENEPIKTEVIKPEKKEEKVKTTISLIPKKLLDKTLEEAKKENIADLLSPAEIDYSIPIDDKILKNTQADITDYCGCKFPDEYQSTLFLAGASIKTDFQKKKLKPITYNDKKFYKLATNLTQIQMALSLTNDKFSQDNVIKLINALARLSYEYKHFEMFEYIENKIEKASQLYNDIQNNVPGASEASKKFVGM